MPQSGFRLRTASSTRPGDAWSSLGRNTTLATPRRMGNGNAAHPPRGPPSESDGSESGDRNLRGNGAFRSPALRSFPRGKISNYGHSAQSWALTSPVWLTAVGRAVVSGFTRARTPICEWRSFRAGERFSRAEDDRRSRNEARADSLFRFFPFLTTGISPTIQLHSSPEMLISRALPALPPLKHFPG